MKGHGLLFRRLVLIIIWIVNNNGTNATEEELCGLSGCQAVDIAKKFTENTMHKMLKMIKPEALEDVFENMGKMEDLIKKVDGLTREVKSLFQPGIVSPFM